MRIYAVLATASSFATPSAITTDTVRRVYFPKSLLLCQDYFQWHTNKAHFFRSGIFKNPMFNHFRVKFQNVVIPEK